MLAGRRGWKPDDADAEVVRRRSATGCACSVRCTASSSSRCSRAPTCYAFPSLHEGFGIPVLEAMAQGTPVLCSDIPALREVAGDAARFVPASDVDAWVAALYDAAR